MAALRPSSVQSVKDIAVILEVPSATVKDELIVKEIANGVLAGPRQLRCACAAEGHLVRRYSEDRNVPNIPRNGRVATMLLDQ